MASKTRRTFELPDGTQVAVRSETEAVNLAARGAREVKAEAPKSSGQKSDSK
jgi:hypothetical protein